MFLHFKPIFQILDYDEISFVGDLLKVTVKKRRLGCFGIKHITNNGKTGQIELINIASDLLLEITCLLNFSK